VILGARWAVSDGGGQVTASPREILMPESNFRQMGLRLFGYLRREISKVGQTSESFESVEVSAYLVLVSTKSQETIHQAERPAHDAASMQQSDNSTCVRARDYTRSCAAGNPSPFRTALRLTGQWLRPGF
jgi:hypothetical protein